MMRTKHPKTSQATTQAPRKAASTASSARCLVAMLNCIPLTVTIRRIYCLVFLMDTRRNNLTEPRKKSFMLWQKLLRRQPLRAKSL
eukprot:6389159-Ditylum_brightwellii.AAC.1